MGVSPPGPAKWAIRNAVTRSFKTMVGPQVAAAWPVAAMPSAGRHELGVSITSMRAWRAGRWAGRLTELFQI
jgi:hypothetical protein